MAVPLLVACGGGEIPATQPAAADPADASGAVVTEDGADAATAAPAVADTADAELPAFMSDFDRVCTTQVGFPGAARYDREPGPHLIQLFEEYREDDNYLETSRELPAAWVVHEDDDYADNSELAAVELIGCSDGGEQRPTGEMCTFDSDGDEVTMELVNASYTITVYEATTGKLVGSESVEAKRKTCPSFISFQEGDTEIINEPTDDQIIRVLKPFVTP